MKSSIRRSALLAAALLASATAASGCGEKSEPAVDEPAPAGTQALAIAGAWQGQLRQRDIPPFRVSVTIASATDPAANRVSYTGIDCSGNWRFLDYSGETYRFREVIDRGRGGKCKGTGTVTLTEIAPERLRYAFRGDGVSSRGVLRPAS